jgi:hypothetical protein
MRKSHPAPGTRFLRFPLRTNAHRATLGQVRANSARRPAESLGFAQVAGQHLGWLAVFAEPAMQSFVGLYRDDTTEVLGRPKRGAAKMRSGLNECVDRGARP